MPSPNSETINPVQVTMTTKSKEVSKIMYGVYSHSQEFQNENSKTWFNGKEWKRQVRYNIYQKEDGTNVKITEVDKNEYIIEDHKRRWHDSVYVGKVVKWIRTEFW